MAKKNHECENCGYVFGSNDRVCKYCGTPNPEYTPSYSWKNVVSNAAAAVSGGNDDSTHKIVAGKGFNIWIFILLLIFAWPIAIIYAIIKAR